MFKQYIFVFLLQIKCLEYTNYYNDATKVYYYKNALSEKCISLATALNVEKVALYS